MATKIQLEAMVKKILELQYCGNEVFSVMFYPIYIVINTSQGKVFIDTGGKEMKINEK